MRFSQDEIFQLVEFIWSSVLNRDVAETNRVFVPTDYERTLAASVMITGAWNGALVLTCPVEMAVDVAASMFDTPGDGLSDADVQDALGELANMVGGNAKALLPEPCHLSLPTVADGQILSMRVRGSEVLSDLTYAAGDQLFRVSLLKNKNDSAGSGEDAAGIGAASLIGGAN